jgi:S-adenosylmethionine:tRNA-ribosyltransferase-isomerase (queuine synthetase)
MKPINVEITMGHDIGISTSYYKPTEREVLDDYLRAQDLLTINADKIILQKQVTELKEKSKDNEYVIKGKLHEKDMQVEALTKKQEEMEIKFQKILAKLDTGKLG